MDPDRGPLGAVQVLYCDDERTSHPGFKERQAHVGSIKDGAQGYAVLCTATDDSEEESRTIKSFVQSGIWPIIGLYEKDGLTYAELGTRQDL